MGNEISRKKVKEEKYKGWEYACTGLNPNPLTNACNNACNNAYEQGNHGGIFAVFVRFGDGDTWTRFQLVCLHSDLDSAYGCAKANFESNPKYKKFTTVEENWIYVGKRTDCDETTLNFGGFVVEQVNVV